MACSHTTTDTLTVPHTNEVIEFCTECYVIIEDEQPTAFRTSTPQEKEDCRQRGMRPMYRMPIS